MEPLVNKFPSFQMVLIISFGDMDLFLATIFSIIFFFSSGSGV